MSLHRDERIVRDTAVRESGNQWVPELLRVCLEMLSLLESLDALGAIQDDVDTPDWKAWGNAISKARHQGK